VAVIVIAVTPTCASGASRRYTATLGASHQSATFSVSYAGSGRYSTTYTSQPPNPGGQPDNNSALDSSTQSWRLKFTKPLDIPACGGRRNPCAHIPAPSAATGTSSATGSVDHTHIDGLFSFDNATIKCSMESQPPAHATLSAALRVAYVSSRKAIAITALNPVVTALDNLPMACPEQGDPTDGLLDSYFTPGFSFANGYGPDRWFTSAAVQIPVATVDRARSITIPLSETRVGTPPKNCAVQHPSYEQCSTGGAWSGVLTLRSRG
jgi:hypothetical protein